MENNLGEKWLEFFKSIDCKYVVFNLEDMTKALTNPQLNILNSFLRKYNNYRERVKGKTIERIERYFCVKRDDFPAFKDDALSFWKWVHEAYKRDYE